MSLLQHNRVVAETQELISAGCYPYFQTIESSAGATVRMAGREVIMAGSSDYLGLAQHPEILAAAQGALRRYGTSCAGSRLMNGTCDAHVALEERLAEFLQREAALVFPSGYQAQAGVLGALTGRHDLVYCDRENHASIIDACRACLARIRKYQHVDAGDLRARLQRSPDADKRFIITDGLFSMDGRLAPLAEITQLAQQHGALVIVDDAHGLGTLGRAGRGTAEALGVHGAVHLVTGSLSKALVSIGGFVAADQDTIHYLKHHARPFMFSGSIPPASAASASAALEIVQREPQRAARLQSLARHLADELAALGFCTGRSAAHIVPVIIGERNKTFQFCTQLLDEGVYANAVVSPGVEPGRELIRVCVMATFSDAQVAHVLRSFARVGRSMDLI